MREMQTKPDLIIGNYSDGNLVATLLAHKLGVTQVGFVALYMRALFFGAVFRWQNYLRFLFHMNTVHHCPCLGENQVPQLRHIFGQIRQPIPLLMPVHS